MSRGIRSLGSCICQSENVFPSRCAIVHSKRPWKIRRGRRQSRRNECHQGHNTQARVAAIGSRSKRRHLKKWLLINLLCVLFLALARKLPPIKSFSTFMITICSLNVCYYILALGKLNYVSFRRKSFNHRNVGGSSEVELVQYFQNSEEQFHDHYWDRFDELLKSLKFLRTSNFATRLDIGVENTLRYVGQMVKNWQISKMKKAECLERFKTLVSSNRKCLDSLPQLMRYWRTYFIDFEKEKVASSYASVSMQECGTLERCNTNVINQNVEINVLIPQALNNLRYQYSSDHQPQQTSSKPLIDYFSFLREHLEVQKVHPFWLLNIKRWFVKRIGEFLNNTEAANYALKSVGIKNVQIGESSVNCLGSVFKSQPSLLVYCELLPFLTLTQDQAYLISRYKSLANDINSYFWNANSAGRTPADSEILFHFFCAHLDTRLATSKYQRNSNYQCDCKRLFSHFVTDSQRNNWPTNANSVSIVRRAIRLPHYDVIVHGTVREVSAGQNNIFLALIYFLFYVKKYDNGKIDSVSLDKNGLDLLWIVGDCQTN